ncbi:MAG: hypothetical protein U5R48_17485 [Gammaproteobacteria bacterium]|nr:hypothetical protein [Gammaproteobacteria bacterium]
MDAACRRAGAVQRRASATPARELGAAETRRQSSTASRCWIHAGRLGGSAPDPSLGPGYPAAACSRPPRAWLRSARLQAVADGGIQDFERPLGWESLARKLAGEGPGAHTPCARCWRIAPGSWGSRADSCGMAPGGPLRPAAGGRTAGGGPATRSGHRGPITASQGPGYGVLLEEALRRATGRSLATHLRERISEPLGLDLHLGLGAAEQARCAELTPAPAGGAIPEASRPMLKAMGEPGTPTHAAFSNPPGPAAAT